MRVHRNLQAAAKQLSDAAKAPALQKWDVAFSQVSGSIGSSAAGKE
jgi:hypothetical protein